MDSADFELLLSTEILEKMLESKLTITGQMKTKKDFDRVKIPGGPKREFLI